MLHRKDHKKLAALVDVAGFQNVLESLAFLADALDGDALAGQLEDLAHSDAADLDEGVEDAADLDDEDERFRE